MLELRLVLIFFLICIVFSAYPILEIKYCNDIFEYIDMMSKKCYSNFKCSDDNISLPEKYTYLYNISNSLFDLDDENINYEKENQKKTYKYIFMVTVMLILFVFVIIIYIYGGKNTYFAILLCTVIIVISTLYIVYLNTKNLGLKEMQMLLYRKYLNHSMMTFFLANWTFLFIYIYLFIQYYDNDYISISLMISIFLFTIAFTITFALILKKITEIYNDTILNDYINLMKKINTVLKEKTIYTITSGNNEVNHEELTKIAENIRHNTDDDNRYFKELAFGTNTLNSLINKYKIKEGVVEITQTDVNKYESFHNKKNIETIKNKVSIVTSYLYAYAVFILIIVYLYMRTIEDNNVYVYVLGIYLFFVIVYYMHITLRQ
jgi:hypothetical protein